VTPLQGLAVAAAGFVAGAVNTIVGSGSLVTFPTLLAVGYAPVVANVSNTVGLVPGSVSGAVGYRRELAGQAERLRSLGLAAMLGGLTGAGLLLALPGSVFQRVVPALVLLASLLVLVQPRLAERVARPGRPRLRTRLWLYAGVFVTAIYGGYFGAAQGVILIALLGIFLDDDMQRLNAAKNVLAAIVNAVAALLFVFLAHVAWLAVVLLAAGAIIGGQAGAVIGRRLSPGVLRWVIVIVGTGVAIWLFIR
jgi:uncharacterized protein